MYRKLIFYFALTILIFSSCDCFIVLTGCAVDNDTGKPIKDVQVNMIIKRHHLENMGYIYDTLTMEQRKEIIKTEGNSERWYFSVPSLSEGRYTKKGPLLTDSLGYFNLFFHTGFCPKYSIELSKEGYCDTIIGMDKLKNNMKIKMDLIN